MLTIRTGKVITDLSKPCDFFCYWCGRELGRAVYFLIFRGLPTYMAGPLIFQVELGADWSIWPVFLLSLTLGTVTGVVFRILMNLAAFWMIEARSIVVFGLTIAQFFAGAYLPLVFFPTWLATLAAWLPFSGIMNGHTIFSKNVSFSLKGAKNHGNDRGHRPEQDIPRSQTPPRPSWQSAQHC